MSDSQRRRAQTVRVLVHTTAGGQAAVGIVRSEWQGATKVTHRLGKLRPVEPVPLPPQGVDLAVWIAWCALLDLVEKQRTDHHPS